MRQYFSIGKAQRAGLYLRTASPGPGTYEAEPTSAGPRYHFAGRYVQSQRNSTPGPANYSPDFRQRLSAITHLYSMAGGRRANTPTPGPGPGSYNVPIRGNSPGGKFSRDQRQPLSKSCGLLPGPAAYHAEPQLVVSTYRSAPRCRFGNEKKLRPESARGGPGPGAYRSIELFGREGKV